MNEINSTILTVMGGLIATAFSIIFYQVKAHIKVTDRFADLVERDIKVSESLTHTNQTVAKNLEENTLLLRKHSEMLTPLIAELIIPKRKRKK